MTDHDLRNTHPQRTRAMTAARQSPGAACHSAGQEPSAEALAAARNVVLYGPQTIALFSENDRRIALALDAFAARQVAEAVAAERERLLDCAKYDAQMGGPKFMAWDRSALDRLRKEYEAIRSDGVNA